MPKKLVTDHCNGYQKGDSPEAQGNGTSGLTTQKVALEPMGPLQILVTLPKPEFLQSPPGPKIPSEQKRKMPNRKQREAGSCQTKDPYSLPLPETRWLPNSTRPSIWGQLEPFSGPNTTLNLGCSSH